mgnify:CR=1 FL=1
MGETDLSISDELMAKLEKYAPAAGHESAEQFAEAILQREITRLEDAGANEKIEDRLRGLGYIS